MFNCLTCLSKKKSDSAEAKGSYISIGFQVLEQPQKHLAGFGGPSTYFPHQYEPMILSLVLVTLSDSPFGGLASSSDMSVVEADWDASLVVENLLQVFLGVLEFHALENVGSIDGVFVVNSKLIS
jgi:hypothetical protein